MKTVLGILAAIVIFIVIFAVVLSGDEDDEEDSCVSSRYSSSTLGGVPEGSYSFPENNALDHITSGWRTEGRPDHRGLDIAQGQGTPIFAFADGVVAEAGPATGFGQWIVIDHMLDGDKYSTVYGHLFPDDLLVQTGDKVKAGQHIANEGYNGEVYPPGPGGSHLHFEVWEGGRLSGGTDVDPQPWLEQAVEPGLEGSKVGEDARTFIIGDSLTEGAMGEIEAALPDATVNARVGRQFSEGLDILKRTSTPYEVVILALGTNGEFSQSEIDQAIEAASGARVVLTTVAGPNVSAASGVNKLVRENSSKVTIADWDARVRKNPSLVGGDGVHLTAQGSKEFASMLAEAAAESKKAGPSLPEEIELPPTNKLASEDLMQKDAIKVARMAAIKFPEIEVIGGHREDSLPDHPEGRAIDLMIPNWETDEGKKLGDDIVDYFYANAEEYNIDYLIWRQELIPIDGEAYMMNDLGNTTSNHFDHVHITVNGAGYPKPGEKYIVRTDDAPLSPLTDRRINNCDNDSPSVDDSLDVTEIPDEYAEWIERSAAQCEQLTAPILAGLYHQESGFQQGLVSPQGALGPGQFIPETWNAYGRKVDEEGNPIGPPGSGDVNSIPDATMASGRYLCDIAEQNDKWKAEGRISGDDTELMLAGYNAGQGAVLEHGGVPPYPETQHYVKIIPEKAKQFEKK